LQCEKFGSLNELSGGQQTGAAAEIAFLASDNAFRHCLRPCQNFGPDGILMLRGPDTKRRYVMTVGCALYSKAVPKSKLQSHDRTTQFGQSFTDASADPEVKQGRQLFVQTFGSEHTDPKYPGGEIRVRIELPKPARPKSTKAKGAAPITIPSPALTVSDSGRVVTIRLDMNWSYCLFGGEVDYLYNLLAFATATEPTAWRRK